MAYMQQESVHPPSTPSASLPTADALLFEGGGWSSALARVGLPRLLCSSPLELETLPARSVPLVSCTSPSERDRQRSMVTARPRSPRGHAVGDSEALRSPQTLATASSDASRSPSVCEPRDNGVASSVPGSMPPCLPNGASEGARVTLREATDSRPTCRRRLLNEFEKAHTFCPKLNENSKKLVARNQRHALPVELRLFGARKELQPAYQEQPTFAPKLNTLSLKLAQERAARMPEVQSRAAQLAAARMAEAYAHYTFRPHVSERSMRIADGLRTSFLTRQQMHLEKRQKIVEEAYDYHPQHFSGRKQLIRLTSKAAPHLSSTTGKENANSPPSKNGGEAESSTTTTAASLVLLKESKKSPHRKSHSTHVRSTTPPPHSTTRPRSRPKSIPLQNPSARSISEKTSPQGGAKPTRKKSAPVSRSKPLSSPSQSGSSSRSKGNGGRKVEEEEEEQRRPCVDSRLYRAAGVRLCTHFSDLNDSERMKRVKIVAERLIKARKVFLVRGGYQTIRRCLRNRGWVELEYQQKQPKQTSAGASLTVEGRVGKRGHTRGKEHRHSVKESGDKAEGDNSESSDSDCDVELDGEFECTGEENDEEEYQILSRMVRHSVPYFVWTMHRDEELSRNAYRDTLLNHFARASSFTTKFGLCSNLRNLPWFGDAHSDSFFPRCYQISCPEEKQAFVDDYRFTAALSILKTLVQRHDPTQPHPSATPSRHTPSSEPPPVVPEETVLLALRACKHFLGYVEHNDIDGVQQQQCQKLTDNEWKTLIQHFYSMRFEGGQLDYSTELAGKAQLALEGLEPYLPQLHMDGNLNIWIIKPGSLSRGRGISCMSRLEEALDLVSCVNGPSNRWMVQKYIERPLLIHGTKFDIRQWFLVTDWNPLTMWMYQDCYLRFSTQQFTLENLDQSIHLCNNSIQRRYENSPSRSSELPESNMWDSDTFQLYLNSLGVGDRWSKVIYPGMKRALIYVLQVTQDVVEYRRNSFELYGADFMLTEDLKPLLIEINSSPTMEASTAVTRRLCRGVMEDTLRVVVDRKQNRDCDTGKFELAFKQQKLDTPSYIGTQLCVRGSSLPIRPAPPGVSTQLTSSSDFASADAFKSPSGVRVATIGFGQPCAGATHKSPLTSPGSRPSLKLGLSHVCG